eukprot:m.130646 g.130646  ORF g.130646 m.130646 type:complete len:653 (+) comp16439_c0_seq2:241-2199(+)
MEELRAKLEVLRVCTDATSADASSAHQALLKAVVAEQPDTTTTADTGSSSSAAEKVAAGLGAELKQALSEGATLDGRAKIAEVVAELAKDEAARGILGEAGLPAACVETLKLAAAAHHTPARIQAFRAIGNLCFDHDANRTRMLEAGGAAALVQALRSTAEMADAAAEAAHNTSGTGTGSSAVSAARTGAGALLNAATDHEETQKMLMESGAIESLVWLLRHAGSAAERDAAFHALQRFTGHDAALKAMAEQGGVRALVTRLMEVEDGSCAETVLMLRAFAETDAMLPSFAGDNIPRDLVHLTTQIDTRPSAASSAALLISIMLSDDTCRKALLGADEGHSHSQSQLTSKQGKETLAMLVQWLQDSHDGLQMAIAGALSIGNLVRDDATAEQIGAHEGVLARLVQLLAKDVSDTQHASLGALKNLCNCVANKTRVLHLAAPPIGPCLLQAMNTSHQPIQYMAASISRSLCLQQTAADVNALAATPELVERLCKLSSSEEPRVQAEAGRALVNFVRFGKSSPPVLQRIVDAGGLASFVGLCKTPHALLHVEGLVGLVLVATAESSRFCPAVRAAHADVQAISMLTEEPGSPEIKCNALSLLAALGTASAAANNHAENTALLEAVRALQAKPNLHPMVLQQAALVLKSVPQQPK